jgi:ketosteroid isomerase-like protein
MKTKMFLAVAGAIALVRLPVFAAGTEGSGDEQQIRKLEQEWVDAMVKRDGAFLQKIESDDYTLTGPDGKVLTKQEDIKNTTEGDTIFDGIKIEKLKVRLYGNTAVVNGENMVKAHSKDGDVEEDMSGPYSWTDVFVKQNGQWKAVATHVTALGPEDEGNEKAEDQEEQNIR